MKKTPGFINISLKIYFDCSIIHLNPLYHRRSGQMEPVNNGEIEAGHRIIPAVLESSHHLTVVPRSFIHRIFKFNQSLIVILASDIL